MRHGLEFTARRDALLQFAHDAITDLDDVRTPGANQMVLVSVMVILQQRESRHAIAKVKPFHHPQPFQQSKRPVNRGQIAPARWQMAEDFPAGKRSCLFAQHAQDRLARSRQLAGFAAQAVVPAGGFAAFENWTWHGGSVEQHTRHAQPRSHRDGPKFGVVEAMSIAGFEQNRRGDVHENTNDNGHQFP